MYRIEVAERARDDADAAHAWMSEHISRGFADAWYRELFRQIETLAKRPTRCPVAPESERFPEEIRELIYGKIHHKNKYRILFTVRGDAVVVLSVYHTARKEFDL